MSPDRIRTSGFQRDVSLPGALVRGRATHGIASDGGGVAVGGDSQQMTGFHNRPVAMCAGQLQTTVNRREGGRLTRSGADGVPSGQWSESAHQQAGEQRCMAPEIQPRFSPLVAE
ncbi:MAG: hypothetical protein ACO3FE_21795 [Planctomycetaceae bacterium]